MKYDPRTDSYWIDGRWVPAYELFVPNTVPRRIVAEDPERSVDRVTSGRERLTC